MIDLQEVLLKKYREQKLGHFYILKAPQSAPNPSEFLEKWVKEFLTKVIAFEKGVDPKRAQEILELGHSDILFQKKEPGTGDYKMENSELSPLFTFQAYRELELKWRFAVVLDAHLIGERYSNKLLKTLEEPQQNTSLIFCHAEGSGFIPTIKSRSITLTIPSEENALNEAVTFDNPSDFFKYHMELSHEFTKTDIKKVLSYLSHESSARELSEAFKKDKLKQKGFFKLFLSYHAAQNGSYQEMEKLIKEIQWDKESSTFHNQYLERLFGLLHAAPIPVANQ